MTSAEATPAPFDPSLVEPKGRSLKRLLAPFAVGIALLSAFLTFIVLTGLTRIEPRPAVVQSFYLINVATILLLVGIIMREVWQMVLARRRGRAAARLHIQVVGLFSVIAVLPAVLVAIIANVTLDRGLDRLFSGPTREVIQNSLTIARAYVQEHAQLIRGDILGMAVDISNAQPLYYQDRGSFKQLLTASAAARNLPGAMIMDKNARPLETADNCVTETLQYTKDRKAFGQSIGSFQHNRFLMAEMDTELEIAEQYIDRCLRAAVDKELTAVQASKAKWWCTELGKRVVDNCVQLHGGYGYMNEYKVARDYVDVRIQTIFGGTTEIMKDLIGRDLGL